MERIARPRAWLPPFKGGSCEAAGGCAGARPKKTIYLPDNQIFMRNLSALLLLAFLLFSLPMAQAQERPAHKKFSMTGQQDPQPRTVLLYSPFGQKEKMRAFDLNAQLAESQKARAEGKSYSYALTMLQEFVDKYYAGAAFTWSKLDVGHYFGYAGTRDIGKNQMQFMYLSWQSYSDGLEWCFFNTELRRSWWNTDPWDIVEDKEAAAKIIAYLVDKKICASEQEARKDADIFTSQYRSFCTEQRTENVPYPDEAFSATIYGVFVKGDLYKFDMQGNFKHPKK